MNKFLPPELRDLSSNKKRVIQQVELQLQQPVRKKYASIKILSIAAVLTMSIGTYSLIQYSQSDNQQATIITEDHTEQLKQYFADDQTTKIFSTIEGESNIFTSWLSDKYVVERITTSSQTVELYYRIANNRIDLITQQSQDALLTVEQLDAMPSAETILQAPFDISNHSGPWQIVQTDATVGGYKNVIVVQNTDGVQITKYYFAPQFGKIKMEVLENNEVVYEENMYYYTYSLETGEMKFDKVEDVQLEPTFHTPWLYSPDNRMRVTLEGLGENAAEEGVASIIVENVETANQTLFTITNVPYWQITPKKVVWVDNDRLLLIIGQAHGMVTVGGEVYLLNITDNILSPILTDLPERQEISKIERIDGEHFYFQRFTYNNDDFEKDASSTTDGEIRIVPAIIKQATNDQISYQLLNSNETTNVSISLNHPRGEGYLINSDIQLGEQYNLIFVDNVLIGVQ